MQRLSSKQKELLNKFLDKYTHLLEEEDYVTFFKKYREEHLRTALYYVFVSEVMKIFNLDINYFLEKDPYFHWLDYIRDEAIGSINITASITKIPSYAFSSCSPLTSIIIPISVTTIGNSAFEDCSNLTTVTFGENSQLTSIGSYAFSGCDSLTSITIPDSVTSIGSSAFESCSSLTSITIPSSVTTIGQDAFLGCSSLTIYCEAASKPSGWNSNWNPSYRPVVWDCLNAKTTEDELVYHVYENEDETKYIVIDAYIGTATDVLIPDTINVDAEEIKVTTIGERAFYYNDTITSATIGDNVTTIGSYAFYDCDSLTSITIPDSVTSIGSSAFESCSSLTSITIPSSVTTIGQDAFLGCSSLTIYCEAASKPSGWDSWWNYSNCPVVWGYKRK